MCGYFVVSVQRYYGTALSEPFDGPNVKTSIPGPKSKQLLGQLNALQVRYIVVEFYFVSYHCCQLVFCVIINDILLVENEIETKSRYCQQSLYTCALAHIESSTDNMF